MPAIATGTGRALLNPTTSYLNKLRSLFGAGSIVALWPQNESAGTVSLDVSGHAYNGAYTGVTLGAAGNGNGDPAASFDGTTSFNNIYSAGLNTDFNGRECTFIAWAKVSGAGVWTDAAARTVGQIRVDGNNILQIRKSTTNNQVDFLYFAGAGANNKTTSSAALGGNTNYICFAITASKTNDAFKSFANGVQLGATVTGLGTWTGSLSSTLCCIGATSTTPGAPWSGSIGPVLLLNRAATASEILQAATV